MRTHAGPGKGNFHSHPGERSFQPRSSSQRAELLEATCRVIASAAQLGWSPKDLLHVLGSARHAIIYRAALRIPATLTTPSLRQAWLQCAPPPDTALDYDSLPGVCAEIMGLPPLPDSHVRDLAQRPDPNDPRAKARSKIHALLKKAESTTYVHEAEALIARAQSLQQRYRLQDVSTSDEFTIVSHHVYLRAPYIKHQTILLGQIARANECDCILIHPAGLVCVLGTKEDAEHTAALFVSLRRQCDWFMRNGEGADAARLAGQTAAYRRSFWLTYAQRIGELLRAANSQSSYTEHAGASGDEPVGEDATHRADLCLARRTEAVERVREELFPYLSQSTLSANSFLGRRDGVAAADGSHFSGDDSGLSGRRQLAS